MARMLFEMLICGPLQSIDDALMAKHVTTLRDGGGSEYVHADWTFEGTEGGPTSIGGSCRTLRHDGIRTLFGDDIVEALVVVHSGQIDSFELGFGRHGCACRVCVGR